MDPTLKNIKQVYNASISYRDNIKLLIIDDILVFV